MPKENIFTCIKQKLKQPLVEETHEPLVRNLSRITIKELVIMKILWRSTAPITSFQVNQECTAKFGFENGGSYPCLCNLSKKGLVKIEATTNKRGREQFLYSPLIAEDELKAELKDPLEKIKAQYDFFFSEL